MGDSIGRQAAINAALLFMVEYCGAAFDEDMQTKMKQRLEGLPSAQPEQKQGEWKRSLGDLESGSIRCSCCDTEFDYYLVNQLAMESCETEFPKFCPNCGAKMSDLK